jgi:hypothetical protein
LKNIRIGATGIGPSQCFHESKGLGNNGERIKICNGALNKVINYFLFFILKLLRCNIIIGSCSMLPESSFSVKR